MTYSSHGHEAETALSDFLQKFVLQTTPEAAQSILRPILDTIDRVPRDLHMFVRELTIAEDLYQMVEAPERQCHGQCPGRKAPGAANISFLINE